MYEIIIVFICELFETEWLIDRKKVPIKWQDSIRRVQDLLVIAKDTTVTKSDIVLATIKKDALTYYECKDMFKILESEEGSQAKNMFGQYNSLCLRNWSTVLKAWERDNIYLCESSRLLIQWVSYECPAMKKTLTSYEKQLSEINRKYNNYKLLFFQFIIFSNIF